MPSDFGLKAMNGVHRFFLKVSGGRIGGNLLDMPVLELTTVGRKSGEKRAVMLTSPLIEGDKIMIVASRGGDDTHPAWFLNLRDQPKVEVALVGREKQPYVAHVADSTERARLWPLITE